LASSWSSSKNDSVWVFHLRHGARFHSGNEVTAADVKYSWVRSVLANQAGAYMLGRFLSNPDKQIKVVDKYTVEVDLGSPQPFFINGAAQDYNALILDSKLVKKHATKSDPWAHDWTSHHDAGSGPYAISRWDAGQQIVLTRFAGYWRGWSGPHFSTVVLRLVPDSTTRRELLERGEADLTIDLTPQDNDAVKQNKSLRLLAPYATQISYIAMTESGPLASPLARQALSYAFPYEAVIKGILKGYARRSYGCLAQTMLGYDPNVFKYQTDLNKARELLLKAGVKPGTTLTYTYADPQGPPGELLQAQLAQIGIKLVLQHLDGSSFYSLIYSNKKASERPNLLAYGWWPDYNEPYDECNTLLASDQAAPNGNNIGIYHNAEADRLLAEMKNANRELLLSDSKKLQDITGRADPAAIWYAEPAEATAMAANLHGYVANPVELRTYYFYTMYRS
jgi:peptide/nickel transport system substrate-binding protein